MWKLNGIQLNESSYYSKNVINEFRYVIKYFVRIA